MHTAIGEPARYEHVALVHSGVDDLSQRLAPSLRRASEERGAVLIGLDDESVARVRSDMGSISDSFTFMPSASRYPSPSLAMAALHQFVTNALTSGAPTAWAIGSIPMRGDRSDNRWARYEHAISEMFTDRPMRGVCVYDASATPHGLRTTIAQTHHSVDGAWLDHHDDELTANDATPERKPDLVVLDGSPRDARAAIERLLGTTIPASTLMDLRLVASELVTNALMHGSPPSEIRVWREPSTCVVQVHDAGSTPIDQYADLREQAGGAHGGFGLWTVGQLADEVHIAHDDRGNSVTAVLALS